MNKLVFTAIVFGIAGAAAVLLHVSSSRRAEALLFAVRNQRGAEPDSTLEQRLSGLPSPAARYLRLALGRAGQAPAVLELRQVGRLRTTVDSDRWMDFAAVHTVAPLGCAFLWNARVTIASLLHVRVLDSLVEGKGSGEVSLQSLVRIGHDGGTAEMNSGSLHRFLAEAVWYPWALMPSEALGWEPIDDHRARATLTCHGTSVTLEFRFAPTGEISGIYSPQRWGSFDGVYRQLGWEGHFSDYSLQDGVLVPQSGEVGWYRNSSLELVWQGWIESRSAVLSSR